jgi:Spy/CpxP family protein refolding chaperone
MNFFQKNKVIIWVLTGLLIITLSALGTMVYHHWYAPGSYSAVKPCGEKCNLLSKELGLSVEQEQKVEQIRTTCRKNGMAISDSLQLKRSDLVTELSKDIPDTIHLRQIAQRIGQLQSHLTNQTIDQYLKISKVCTPEQREKLSSLYFEMMGCCKQGEGKGMRKKCMKE